MTINAWKTSFIGINKPPKVLTGSADDASPVALWPYANDATDTYWSGGANPQPYQWQVSFSITPASHGSNLTRTPYSFTANDIEVGDFVAGASDGKVLEIMSIISKDDGNLVAIVEDRLRYNTFRDPTGLGIFGTPGPVIFFGINELGFPMLDPLPGAASGNFFSNVMSRFQYMNPLTNYILEQDNHGFERGNPICIENERFAIASASNITKYIGTVIYSGPGPNQFILRPANGIIDFAPGLPGNIGDYVFPSFDNPGTLTTDDISRRPLFIKISNAIQTITSGSGIDPTGIDGDTIEINRIQILLYSGSGTFNLDDAITLINQQSDSTKITAVKIGAATEVISDATANGSALGIIAGYAPFSAEINNVLITFTTTTVGSSAYGDPTVAAAQDIAQDINSAKIPDLVATVNNDGNIVIRNNAGGAITIVNVSPDTQGNNFAGPNSISSLTLSTPANTTTSALRLYRDDGGPMTLRDIQGNFLTTAGVISGQNGRYAIGLNIEQGLRSSGTTMVANIAARDALHPLPGDQAYVLDAGNGEWAIFVWDGSTWLQYGNQRSDDTDARTLVYDIDVSTILSTGYSTYTLGNISQDRNIKDIKVLVTSPCPTGTEIEILQNGTVFTDTRDFILDHTGQYQVDSDYRTTGYTEVAAKLNLASLGTGQLTVILTYI
jgi:hypothetical protein